MNNHDYEIKTLFTLEDISKSITKINFYGVDVPTLVSLADYYNVDLSSYRAEFAGGKGLTLWEYCYIRYSDNIVAIKDENTYTSQDFKELFKAFVNVYLRTKSRYESIIDNYENIKADLLKKLNTTSKTKFNDTPQAVGSFENDVFNSNVTLYSTEVDVATPIARLKEVENNLANYFALWADEFSGIFINELNY